MEADCAEDMLRSDASDKAEDDIGQPGRDGDADLAAAPVKAGLGGPDVAPLHDESCR